MAFVGRKKRPDQTTKVEIHRLGGKRKGAVLKEQVRFEGGDAVAIASRTST